MEPTIEIGFSNNIYNNPADVVASVQIISNDFSAIEIELAEEAQAAVFDATPIEYMHIVDGLCRLKTERGLRYSVHAAWYGPCTDLTSSDHQERLASVDLLARSIRFAADIGAGTVTCHPGHRHRQDEQQLVANLVDSLQRIRDLITRACVTLCVENMGAQRPSHALFSNDNLAEVCDRAGVAVCLDIVHLASVYPDISVMLKAIDALAPLTQHVHLADMVRPSHRHLPIGKGDLPLDAILRCLAANGYRRQAIVEEYNKGWAPEDYLAGALAFRDRERALAVAH